LLGLFRQRRLREFHAGFDAPSDFGYYFVAMTAVAEKLDKKLRQWAPSTSHEVEQRVEELIASADADALDVTRSRHVEQEVLDLLDEPAPR
jgi:hypothetical protein